ncbi:hypothetical protein ACM66B_005488 [Microbotryomycetes sp. NB124-2]
MEALLASPSMRQWSPDSSFDSDHTPSSSSDGSPRLPGWMHLTRAVEVTPDTMAHSTDDEDDELSGTDLVVRPTTTTRQQQQQQPAWLTDELDEEWTVDEEDEGESVVVAQSRPPSRRSSNNNNGDNKLASYANTTPTAGSKTPTATFNTCLTSLNKPRVPSSLRFAYTSAEDHSTALASPQQHEHEHEDYLHDNMSTYDKGSSSGVNSVGTCIVKSNPSTTDERGQLHAAVSALQVGHSAGLGAAQPRNDGTTGSNNPNETPARDRLGGLISLFNPPPSPPAAQATTMAALPQAATTAPSAEAFTFEAPLLTPRRSWKAMQHFSPEDNGSATPTANLASSLTRAQGTPSGPTPARSGHVFVPQAPSLQARSRYLHRSEAAQPAHTARLDALKEQSEDGQSPARQETEDDATPRATTTTMNDAPPTQHAQSPMPPLRLFEFQYDTFTREHLAALVDEIDELGQAGPGAASVKKSAQETSFVEVMPIQQDTSAQGDDSRDSAEASRSIKRIRLSPPAVTAERTNLTPARQNWPRRTGRRLSSGRRRSAERRREDAGGFRTSLGASASARRIRAYVSPRRPALASSQRDSPNARADGSVHSTFATTRERLDDANALLERIRAKKAERDRAREEAGRDFNGRDWSEPEATELTVPGTAVSSRDRIDSSALGQRDPFIEQSRVTTTPKVGRSVSNNMSARPSPLPQLAEKASALIRSHLAESAAAASSPGQLGHSRHSSEPAFSMRGSMTGNGDGRRRIARQFDQHNETLVEEEAERADNSERGQESNERPAVVPTRHVRHRSLTTIGPDQAQTLMSNFGLSKTAVFDLARGQWAYADNGVSISDSTEQDPFRDVDESRTSGETRIANVRAAAAIDGLSGLGITAGTPNKTRTTAQEQSLTVVVSPPDANHFEPQPREQQATSDEAMMQENADDDTGTWGDGASTQRREQRQAYPSAREVFAPPESTPAPSAVRSAVRPLPQTPLSAAPSSLRSQGPRSVLKTRSDTRGSAPTPGGQSDSQTKEPRSVSFSDGRTTGKIVGLVVERGSAAHARPSALRHETLIATTSLTRSHHQHVLMAGGGGEPGSLELVSDDDHEEDEDDEDEEGPDLDEASPSLKVSARSKSLRKESGSIDLSADVSGAADTSRRAGSLLSTANQSSTSRTFRRTTAPDATFLTECSFGVSVERLVKQITDVEPFEPHWDTLKTIDLSNKGAESVVRMKDFLPNLDQANLNNNQIAFLTGVPPTLRTLLIASNRLTSIASFGHLQNLERIDLSDNQLDSLHQLSCLRHLRELKADRNLIADLTGLAELDGLVRLSLAENVIETVDFASCKWSRLELLNLNRNKIGSIEGVESLQALSLLNLDHNRVTMIEPKLVMTRLRVLRLCDNPIKALDVSFVPKLRTLYVDSARLGTVYGTETLRKLENLSIRDQDGEALTLTMRDVRDIRRLYLSGNPLPQSFPSEKFFNLVYLELAMCQITSLPADLANVIPNVRVLNLNFNFVQDLEPLAGLTRLTSLSVVGARLSKVRPVASVLETMHELQTCDLRMNPLTLPFYPPFISPPSVAMPSHAEHQILHPDDEPTRLVEPRDWSAIDKKFRRTLPDEYYFKRASYRAVVLHSVPSLLQLDGLCLDKERPKLARVIEKLTSKR